MPSSLAHHSFLLSLDEINAELCSIPVEIRTKIAMIYFASVDPFKKFAKPVTRVSGRNKYVSEMSPTEIKKSIELGWCPNLQVGRFILKLVLDSREQFHSQFEGDRHLIDWIPQIPHP